MNSASNPEKVIIERSGHLSKEGLRSYERTSVPQIQTACKATVTSKQKGNDENQANLPLECKPPIESLPPIPPSDALKTLNFQTVHGGVFNINLHINQ